jgi:hypothetical protein
MSSNASPDIVTNGLVLCLDAADKRSYPGSGATWFDRSSNNNNGTLINGPTFSGANGGGIVFNGSNHYVNNPLVKTANCTFSCWARTTVLNNSMLFNAGPDGGGPDLFFASNYILWNVWDGYNNPFITSTPASVTNGNFHQYVVVNDSASNAKLYYDGNLLGTALYKNASANTNLTIGGNINTYMWNGSISNFLVYNRILTPEEIKQNFNNTKSKFNIL